MARVLIWPWDVAGGVNMAQHVALKIIWLFSGIDHRSGRLPHKGLHKTCSRVTGGSRSDTNIFAHACAYFPVVRLP